jgi:hypothetical protein
MMGSHGFQLSSRKADEVRDRVLYAVVWGIYDTVWQLDDSYSCNTLNASSEPQVLLVRLVRGGHFPSRVGCWFCSCHPASLICLSSHVLLYVTD